MASILVMDDDQQVQAVLRGILDEAGSMVVIASNGQQGLQQFRREPANLVLPDIFSRSIVGWMIALREAAQLAEQLIAETVAKYALPPFSYKSTACVWCSLRRDRGRGAKTDGDHPAY